MKEVNIIEVNESEDFWDEAHFYRMNDDEDLEIACAPHVAEWLDDCLNAAIRYKRRGGAAKTEAKARASRENGKKGGRPRNKDKR